MLITNGMVLTFGDHPRVIPCGAVCIQGEIITAVGFTSELLSQYPGETVLDAKGKVIMPGLICGHTHFYSAFARGMAIPGSPAENFLEILEKLWWKLDRALTLEDCRLSAQTALVDAVRHGTTTLIDHHASPNAIDGSLDALADAVLQSGLRASLCYEVTDRNGPDGARAGLQENVRFARRLQSQSNPLLGACFGVHASFTVSDDTLAKAVGYAKELNIGLHLHVAEGQADEADSLKKYGMKVVERLDKFGALGPKTLAVHCVHVDDYELDLLRMSKTSITHQPRSNMNNAVGLPNVGKMLKKGINVSLGNDGFTNNMFVEIHTAYLAHKLNGLDPRILPGDVLMKIAFDNNTHLAEMCFGRRIGYLAPGALADIILLDYYPYTPLTDGNYPWQLIFGMDGSQVTHTIVAGKMLMADRRLLTLDEEAIAAKGQELAPRIWQRVMEM